MNPLIFTTPAETGRPVAKNQEGMVLLVMLWILTALAVLTLSFARESRLEIMTGRNARSLEQAYYIARAGMESSIYQIIQKRLNTTARQSTVESEPDPIDLGKISGNFGGGSWQVDIQDESGKININTVSQQQLSALMRAIGIADADALILTDSILDWRDTDNMPRDNGAENEYYQEQGLSYTAKNSGRIDALEELLLVRGMTRDYYYGLPEQAPDGGVTYKYGLSRYLTIYSTRDQVNVNFAALPVLMSIPGMPEDAARMIYERRQQQPFRTNAEINREISAPLSAGVVNRLTTAQTGVFSLTAMARENGSRARRVIRAVISLNSSGVQMPYQTLYWNENVVDYEGVEP